MSFGRRLGVRVSRLLAVTGLATASLLVGVVPEAHAASQIKILQFNMCGNVCNNDGMTVVTDIENSINASSPQPAFVTLEEVCGNQFSRLWGDLAPYYGEFYVTVPGACAGGDDYGIAILTRTNVYSDLGSWWLPKQVGYTADESRKVGCIQTSTFGGSQPIIACVTHISTNTHNQAGQITYVANKARGYWSGHKVLVGGDFNVTPTNAYMNPMYESYYSPAGSGIFNEVDSSNEYRTGGGFNTAYNEYTVCGGNKKPCGDASGDYQPTSKIDYVFVSDLDFFSLTSDATYAAHSDHAPLWGWATPS